MIFRATHTQKLVLLLVKMFSTKHVVGIFTREQPDLYQWLVRFLLIISVVKDVRQVVITNNFFKFHQEVPKCSFAILYHSKKRGRLNVTDVTDSLYDRELQYLSDTFGKKRVLVVIDDLEDSSDYVKMEILDSQQSIQNLSKELFLFSTTEKALLEDVTAIGYQNQSNLKIKLDRMKSIVESRKTESGLGRWICLIIMGVLCVLVVLPIVLKILDPKPDPQRQRQRCSPNKTAKYEPQMPDSQNFGAEIPEFQYSMNYKKLGMCIIINNKKFHDSKKLSVRDGTDKDAEDLSRCFGDLGFEATIHNNLSCEEMKRLLKSVAKSDHSDSACFACILLSHGKEGQICGTDGAIPINTLTKHFRGNQCRSLLGKPKLFFIQACRGPKKDEGVVADSEPADSSLEEDANPGSRIPVEADFLFVYATVPGYVSWRDTERGTWFIQALCEVLNQYWNLLDILQMLTRVNNQVANKPGQIKQMPSVDSRLTKSLYFKMFHTVNPSGSNIIRKQGGKPISF